MNKILSILSLFFILSSCIKNDVPYPVVDLAITDVTGEGFVLDYIDVKNRKVILALDEKTDVSKVHISSVEYTEGAKCSMKFGKKFDMRTPIKLVLSFYQDYNWEIIAQQEIERYIKVRGQVGDEIFDVLNKKVIVPVAKGTDLSNIDILEMKLGPKDISTYDPPKEELKSFSLSHRVTIVDYFDYSERWRIYIEEKDIKVSITQADVWSTLAYLSAAGDTGGDFGFRYKESSTSEWVDVLPSQIINENGAFSTKIQGLKPNVSYDFMAYSGEDNTPSQTHTTQAATILDNGDFEQWNDNKGYWLPSADGALPWWGTGNPGSITGGVNITTPHSADLRPGSAGSLSAYLKSQKVLGLKLAAGNIFLGSYVATKGTNGIVAFGTPFTSRPQSLKGWVKYECGAMDNIGMEQPPGLNLKKGDPDQGMIYIALGTWTPEEYGISAADPGKIYGTDQSPLIVDTRDKSTFFNPKSDAVVAYGEVIYDSSFDWTEFEIPLEYKSTSIIPTHLIIVCTGSRFGDYFTGSSSTSMWLDDLSLVY